MARRDELLAELRLYRPADELEAGHRSAVIELLETASDPFVRSHFGPGHITASCFVIDPETRRLLLHHHRRLDRWLQMGGHVEADESSAAAALREGSEESGLTDLELLGDGIFDVDVHAIPAGKGEPDHHHFDVRYVARTRTPDAIRLDASESKELAWTDLDQAVALMNEEASSRVIRKIRSLP